MGASHSAIPLSHRGRLGITDAATYLSVGEHEFARLVAAGEIPLVTWVTPAGREMKGVRVKQLDAFLERHEDRAPTPGARWAERRTA
jgi:hypothetical protein